MSYERFDRIRVSPKGGDTVEEKYKLEDLKNKFIVWKKNRLVKGNKPEYRIYDNMFDFGDDLDFMEDNDKLFHEVILGAQKLKFDIDMKSNPLQFVHDGAFPEIVPSGASNLDDPPEIIAFNHIVNYFCHHIKQQFLAIYGTELGDSQLIITDSSRVGVKYSAHIIVSGYYVSGNKQACEFANSVNKVIAEQYKEIMDMSVYKPIQNFRLVGCHNGDKRFKRILTEHTFGEASITNISGCQLLPDIVDGSCTDSSRKIIAPSGGDIDLALDITRGITKGHTFRGMRSNMMTYDRDYPTHCEICAETHHNDNSMIISMVPSTKTVKLYMSCRQCPRKESVFVGEFEPLDSSCLLDKTNWPQSMIKRNIETNIAKSKWSADTRILAIKSQNKYCEPTIRDFELADTLIIKAAMKMGKTKALKRYIEAHYPTGQLCEPIIRIISFRQTFSNNIKEKFPDFSLYSDVQGELTQDRLIVQIESLHRLKVLAGGTAPDLLILDECESIFEQFNAGLIKNVDCFSKFLYLLRFSKRVILMDALVSDRTYNILVKLRSPDGIVFHNNEYKNATEDKYNITHSYDIWLKTILDSLTAGDKIAIPSSSLKVATEVDRIIREKFPNLAVKLYSSNTKISEKKAHLSNVAHYWKQYDVVIYTPTISAGVSFEEKHFNKVFAYFTDKSCPVETCIQMMGRVRDVSTKEYYLCLNATGNNYPCDTAEIEEALHNTRSVLYTDSTNTTAMAISPEYADNGTLILHKTPFYTVWLENTRMINISKNYFVSKLIGILKDFGSTIAQIATPEMDEDEKLEFTETKRAITKAMREELSARIVGAKDASNEEIVEIRRLMDAQEDLTDDQQNEYDRHKFRQDYAYDGEIATKMVDKYYKPQMRKVHKNIKKIYSKPTYQEALLDIQREERAANRYLMESELEQRDLSKNYQFLKHRCAIDLLHTCGWSSLTDNVQVEDVDLALIFTEKGFLKVVNEAAIEFNIREPYPMSSVAMIEKMDKRMIVPPYVKFIDKILHLMYAVHIKMKEDELEDKRYFLKASKAFKYETGLETHIV
jgi:hypothetical protein